MRFACALLAALAATTITVAAAEIDSSVAAAFGNWGLPVPNSGSLVFCHGYSCNFRTQIGISSADQARLAGLMAPGRASADAERHAIAQTEAWFEKRVAPQTGTAHAKARASVGWGVGGDPSQFDCVDTTANTTSLLAGGPHFTATIRDKKSGQRWTVDPWTHDNGQLPDVWPIERWTANTK